MKYNYIYLLLSLLLSFYSCTGNNNHNHTDEEREHIHSNKSEEELQKGHNHDTHNNEHNNSASENHSKESYSDEIIIDSAKAKEAGIKAIPIHKNIFNGIIKVTGEILPTRENEVTVVATVPGTVNFSTPLLEGSNVNKNKALFTINSSNIEGGDISEKAKINFEIAQIEYNRIKDLYKEQIVSESEYNTARQNFEEARINYDAIGKNLTSNGKIISAPISGFVKNCFIKEGDYVQAGQPVLVIAHDSNLYLKAEIPERYYHRIYDIRSANFRTSYDDKIYNLEEMGGKIISKGRSSDGNSFYIPITFCFKNTGKIISGSYVEVFLKTSSGKETISLPLSAITEEQGNYFVYKQLDETCYKKSEVTLGANDGINVEITNGICEGERIVVNGAYQIKLASAVGTIPAHSHEH